VSDFWGNTTQFNVRRFSIGIVHALLIIKKQKQDFYKRWSQLLTCRKKNFFMRSRSHQTEISTLVYLHNCY